MSKAKGWVFFVSCVSTVISVVVILDGKAGYLILFAMSIMGIVWAAPALFEAIDSAKKELDEEIRKEIQDDLDDFFRG